MLRTCVSDVGSDFRFGLFRFSETRCQRTNRCDSPMSGNQQASRNMSPGCNWPAWMSGLSCCDHATSGRKEQRLSICCLFLGALCRWVGEMKGHVPTEPYASSMQTRRQANAAAPYPLHPGSTQTWDISKLLTGVSNVGLVDEPNGRRPCCGAQLREVVLKVSLHSLTQQTQSNAIQTKFICIASTSRGGRCMHALLQFSLA